MQRVTVTLDDDLMAEIERIMTLRGYQNRSEAIRDLARVGVREARLDSAPGQQTVAALVYVYDHSARELSKRLTQAFHDHHDLSLATMHIHLDHDNCLELTVLQGASEDVQHMAEHVIAERGVRHGRLVAIPVEIESQRHGHPHGPGHGRSHGHDDRQPHSHIRVK